MGEVIEIIFVIVVFLAMLYGVTLALVGVSGCCHMLDVSGAGAEPNSVAEL